jgi:hypothetical protein
MPRKRKPATRLESQPTGIIEVLPHELQAGDRLTEATGNWEVASRPHPIIGGKTVHVTVRKVEEPSVTELRRFAAHERLTVRRSSVEH